MKYLAFSLNGTCFKSKEFDTSQDGYKYLKEQSEKGLLVPIAVLESDCYDIHWYNEDLGLENVKESIISHFLDDERLSKIKNVLIEQLKNKLLNKHYTYALQLEVKQQDDKIKIIPNNFFTALLLVDIEFPGALIKQHYLKTDKGEFKWENEQMHVLQKHSVPTFIKITAAHDTRAN